MKRFIALIIIAAVCFTVIAEEVDNKITSLESERSIISLNVGFVSDGYDSHGYGVFIKSASFFSDGPFYYGFGSLFGSFVTTKEAFFETGFLVGYNKILDNTELDFDLFLDILVTGGRINQETLIYQAEAPALHFGLSLGFPASLDIDGAISIAPVIRPYNIQTRTWDFSRSYINLSFALRFKSYSLREQHPWSESFGSANTKGGNL
jgi:hypothetical protein